jgi:hypothetical protein
MQGAFGFLTKNLELDVVPKAGHWIGRSFPRKMAHLFFFFFFYIKCLTNHLSQPMKIPPGLLND